jgi:DNA polymerase-3 subunit alpha
MYGVIDFYLEAKEAGIRPIIGCEVYVALSDRRSKAAVEKDPYHLILLAKNQEGYSNLLQLVTRAHLEGFYYKPRVDKELLEQHHRGLVALSACVHGEIGQLILQGRYPEAQAAARWYQEVFEDYYLELQRHPMPELEQINRGLLSLSAELGIPVVATNDVHYVNKEDAPVHDLLLCIQTNTSIHDDKRIKMAGDFFYLKSHREMADLFSDLPEAVENARRIAEQCDLDLELGCLRLPEVETPPGKTADEYLAELCWQGLRQCYSPVPPEAEERLAYELEVIRQTQFAHYFLVVWDIVSFARERNILFGVRGSAAASLALYCLGVTSVDPLAHRLIFERFLNVERKEMPDIDLDFQDDRRDEVIAYVAQKYGQDRVAQIITFGTLGARAAIRDVGRALGMPYSQVDRVARLVPPNPGITLERALEENVELRNLYQQDSAVRELVDSAKKLEGVARHASTHAAGVVISREPLTQYVPLQRASKGDAQGIAMTQFSMENIARVGLLKMDLLGLANLTILAKAREIIRHTRGVEIDLHRLPLDDAKTFELLSSGETGGIFQLEGGGMRRYIRELKPSSFSDIAAMIALYRPGPKEFIPTFIRAKHGLEPIRYPHPALSQILEETYGVIVYQDQVLLGVQAFAGYTLGEADIVRKAMGKKIPEIMKKERERFIAGAVNKGFSRKVAQQVFDIIEPFAGYAFNKAHSVSYALIAYQTAYLKANYPVEYMTALLISHTGQQEKVAAAIGECQQKLGIAVLPPDINKSEVDFSIEKREGGDLAIRFGLAAIKNVGAAALEPILAARRAGGEFRSIEDFCRRADLRGINRRVLESLIKAGALDCLGDRGALLYNLDRLLSLAQREQRLREKGQTTMFDLWGENVPLPLPALELLPVDIPAKEKLSWEKELLGVYLSEHPFRQVSPKLVGNTAALCGQIDAEMAGQLVTVVGMVTAVRQSFTRNRRPFVTATLEDLVGSLEVTCWNEVYQRTQELWTEGNILLVRGKVRVRDDQVQLVCEGAERYQPQAQQEEVELETGLGEEDLGREGGRLVITLTQSEDKEADLSRLEEVMEIIREHPGEDKVYLAIDSEGGVVKLEMNGIGVDYSPELHRRLVGLVGEEGVKLEK